MAQSYRDRAGKGQEAVHAGKQQDRGLLRKEGEAEDAGRCVQPGGSLRQGEASHKVERKSGKEGHRSVEQNLPIDNDQIRHDRPNEGGHEADPSVVKQPADEVQQGHSPQAERCRHQAARECRNPSDVVNDGEHARNSSGWARKMGKKGLSSGSAAKDAACPAYTASSLLTPNESICQTRRKTAGIATTSASMGHRRVLINPAARGSALPPPVPAHGSRA